MNNGNVAVLKINHLVCIFNKRTGVRTDEEFVLANAHYKWRLLAGCNNLIGCRMVKHCYGVCPYHLVQGQLYGCKQVCVFLFAYVFYQLHKHFRISRTLKGKAF